MKKSIFITVTLFVITSITNLSFAQETAVLKTRTKSNQTNERTTATNQLDCVVRISPADTGCSIVFDNAIVSPKDAASGLPTGKRMHKPICFVVNLNDNTIAEVLSPRDVATGQATGKRSSEPKAIISKGTYTWIKASFDKGAKQDMKIFPFENGEFSLPADNDNGEYELEISFTYQKIEMTNDEKSIPRTYVSGRFILDIDGVLCRSIKGKGVRAKSFK